MNMSLLRARLRTRLNVRRLHPNFSAKPSAIQNRQSGLNLAFAQTSSIPTGGSDISGRTSDSDDWKSVEIVQAAGDELIAALGALGRRRDHKAGAQNVSRGLSVAPDSP